MTSFGKDGPFRATALWKEAINIFRCMPTKKHRRGLRVHPQCFTGEEAVNWFLQKLRQSDNFGAGVTWEQSRLLLEKLYIAGVFTTCGEAVAKFKPNNTLYKISPRAALKTLQIPVSGLFKQKSPQIDLEAQRVLIKAEAANKVGQAEKLREETTTRRDCWKDVVYSRLQQLLDGVDVSTLLPSYEVNGYHIVENAYVPHYLTLAEELEHSNLKSWLIGAMKNLSHGEPKDKIATHIEDYTNFQNDVFKEIANYFKGQPSLIPPELTKAIFDSLDYLLCRENTINWMEQEDEAFFMDSKSTEDLLLNMSIMPVPSRNPFLTQCAKIESSPCTQDSHQSSLNDKESSPVKTGLNPFKTDTGDWIESGDAGLENLPSDVCWDWESMLPRGCVFETEFVTEVPVTRVVPRPERKHIAQSLITPQEQYALAGKLPILTGKTLQHSSSMLDTPLSSSSLPPLFSSLEVQSTSQGCDEKPNLPTDIHLLEAWDLGKTPKGQSNLPPRPSSSLPPPLSSLKVQSSGQGCDEKPNLPTDSHLLEARDVGKTPEGQLNFSPRPSESLLKKRKRKSHKYNLSGIFSLASTPLAKMRSSSLLLTTPQSEFSETASLLDVGYIDDDTRAMDFESMYPTYPMYAMSPMSMKKRDASRLIKAENSKGLNVNLALENVMKLMACSMESPPPIDKPEPVADPSANITPPCRSTTTSPAGMPSHSTPYCNTDSPFSLEVSDIATVPGPSPEPKDIVPECATNNVCTSKESIAEKLWQFHLNSSDTGNHNVDQHKIELLHLLLLTLPPANRARLSLLLSFMNTVIYKEDFTLHPILCNVTMVINSFKTSILAFEESEDVLVRNPTLPHETVRFLLEHKDAVFNVPSDLFDEVQRTLSDMREIREESSRQHSELHQEMPAYCERVSQQEFEKQQLRDSEMALFELLEQITEDRNMTMKEKRQRLKDFSELYPHIYKKRFPTQDDETKVLRPISKSKSLLTRIKTLRL